MQAKSFQMANLECLQDLVGLRGAQAFAIWKDN